MRLHPIEEVCNTVVKKSYFIGVDIGNTHTEIGLLDRENIHHTWRVATKSSVTGDELAVLISFWLHRRGIDLTSVRGVILSSVVPPANRPWAEFTDKYLTCPLIDAKTIVQSIVSIDYPRPHEIGTDRLVNAAAAFDIFESPCIVADFGTATTFDCISEKGTYLGGAIAPGIDMSIQALFSGTSKLPLIRLGSPPSSALGKSTEDAIRSGILFGFAGMTDRIVQELERQFTLSPLVIATGGLAPTVFPMCQNVKKLVPDLTMHGLRICLTKAFDC